MIARLFTALVRSVALLVGVGCDDADWTRLKAHLGDAEGSVQLGVRVLER